MASFISNNDMQWDSFPMNLCEMFGPIPKRNISLEFSKAEVWVSGKCIHECDIPGSIKGNVINNIMRFTVDNRSLKNYIRSEFIFEEISTNSNRIIWSRDLMNQKNIQYIDFVPYLVSLFYKNGVLMKAAFNIHNQNSMVEFYK